MIYNYLGQKKWNNFNKGFILHIKRGLMQYMINKINRPFHKLLIIEGPQPRGVKINYKIWLNKRGRLTRLPSGTQIMLRKSQIHGWNRTQDTNGEVSGEILCPARPDRLTFIRKSEMSQSRISVIPWLINLW